MKNFIKDQFGLDILLLLNEDINEYVCVGIKGNTYHNLYSVYIVKFSDKIKNNSNVELKYLSHELSFSKKSDAVKVAKYIQSNKNKK